MTIKSLEDRLVRLLFLLEVDKVISKRNFDKHGDSFSRGIMEATSGMCSLLRKFPELSRDILESKADGLWEEYSSMEENTYENALKFIGLKE